MEQFVGKNLGKYQIVGSLGRGGMAEVFKAYQASLDRYVAVKVIRTAVDDPEHRARFDREAKSAAALRHPNIVQVYDFDVDQESGRPYMVMELVAGVSLAEYLETCKAAGSALSIGEIAQIIDQVCAALAYAHQQGVIHRDVKPSNIMRDQSGRMILMDLGLATIASQPHLTASGVGVGTAEYMAPEQAMGEAVDGRADLYALGVILYQLLTGQLPYHAENRMAIALKHISEPVPDPRTIKPGLPDRLARLVIKSMAKQPSERFQTADELLAEFRAALAAGMEGAEEPALDTEAIRQLLTEAFDDQELLQLCFDHFRVVYERMSSGEGKEQKIQRLLEYCERHDQIELLLEQVQKANPAKYARFASRLQLPPSDKGEHVEEARKPAAPFMAPRDVPYFVGRVEELANLREMLTRAGACNIYCLVGMGGIGKTTLAIRLAYMLRGHFTDGVLWANSATSGPLATLDTWARQFGCDFSGVPDVGSRAAALRGVLVGRKVLLVFDDVRSAEQVRPLLPGEPQCAVLMTSRDEDVAAALGAVVCPVSAFVPRESLHLMISIVGSERVGAERQAADEICDLLHNLPLAVEIIAQRLHARKRDRLAELAEQLRDEKKRLRELKFGDREVRASFELSWQALGEDLQRGFSRLAVFEGRPFAVEAFAAAAELDQWAAKEQLGALRARSLLMEEGQIYYRQHPLLADFAREHLAQDPAAETAAYERMAQYYLAYVQQRRQVYAELELESANLSAGIRIAYERKMWQVVIDYADALEDMWFVRGRYTSARRGYGWACEAAQALGDRRAQAASLLNWGRACIEQCDYDEAERHLSHSLAISEELGDLAGVAGANYNLGRIAIEKTSYDKAARLLQASRRIREQLGDQAGVAETLYIEADIPFYRGDYEGAKQLGERALGLQQGAGNKLGCIRCRKLLAATALKQEDYPRAEQHCRQALAICEEIQEQSEVAVVLYLLSEVGRHQGDLASARDDCERSLALLKVMGDRKMQGNALYRLSLIDADLRDYTAALQEGQQSRNLFRELQDDWALPYVLLNLGDVHRALHEPEEARTLWIEALDIIRGLPQAHPLTESLSQRLGQA